MQNLIEHSDFHSNLKIIIPSSKINLTTHLNKMNDDKMKNDTSFVDEFKVNSTLSVNILFNSKVNHFSRCDNFDKKCLYQPAFPLYLFSIIITNSLT